MKKYLIGLVIVLVIVIIGLAVYYQGPNKSINQLVSGTTNWQTYRSEQYGFELKYPADLKAQIISLGLPSSYFVLDKPRIAIFPEGSSGANLLPEIYDKCSEYIPKSSSEGKILWREAIINGRRFCFRTNSNGWFSDILGTSGYITKISKYGANFYVIFDFGTGQSDVSHWNDYLDYHWSNNLSTDVQTKIKKGSKKIFESILSTFKTLPEPTSWQTYRNDQYGFELRLPKDFKEYRVKTFGSEDEILIDFYATTSDSSWGESGIPKDYATLFRLRLMSIDKWNEMVKQCLKPCPDCSAIGCSDNKQVLAKINGYAIDNMTDNSGILNDYEFGAFRLKSEYLRANLEPIQ